jgi:DNA-binding GntR family transcriptional regulator
MHPTLYFTQPGSQDASMGQEISLVDRVREEILRMILSGELTVGQKINEPHIAARLNTSRVPVREALRSLQASGLVMSRKNAGVFVRQPAPEEIIELYTFRALLDGFCGECAAKLADPIRKKLVIDLEVALSEMRLASKNQDTERYYFANLSFHRLIVQAAGHQKIFESYQSVIQQLHLCRLKNLSKSLSRQASMEEHRSIVQAIALGQATKTKRLLTTHVTSAEHRFFETER